MRRLLLMALAGGALAVAVLAGGVAAGWWLLPLAMLVGFAAAVLGGLGLLAIGLRRVLGLLHANLRQGRAQVNQAAARLDQLDRQVDQLGGRLDQIQAALAGTTGSLAQATTDLAEGLHEVRAATGEDRLELLRRLEQVTGSLTQVIGGVDQVRQDARAERVEQTRRLAALERATRANAAADARQHAGLPDRVYARVEAQLGLRALVAPRAPMPPLGGWALDADIMHAVAALLWHDRPELIVECGSGSSSVWLGYLIERLGLGRVISLEHDERFLRASRALVAAHGLRDLVEIRHAPLRPWAEHTPARPDRAGPLRAHPDQAEPERAHLDQAEPERTPPDQPPWYDPAALDGLRGIGLLLVDGPPQAIGRQARYPAGPMLIPRCIAGAVIVLDDTDRDDEQEVGHRWLAEWPELERQPPTRAMPAEIFRRGRRS